MSQAIVTGGAIRVGKAISLALADAGYDIILVFHDSFDEARAVYTEIESKNRRCYLNKCDLSKKESIDQLFAEITRKHDDVRLLVNSSAIFGKYSFSETSEQVFDAHMNVNLKAPFFMTQNYLQYINKRPHIEDAHIMNIVDKRIDGINTGHFVYHLSKKALFDLTMMNARDLAPKIRVNAVSPGSLLQANPYEIGKKAHYNVEFSQDDKAALKLLTDAIIKLDGEKDLTGQNIIIDAPQ